MNFKVVVDFRRGAAFSTTLSATDEEHAKELAKAMARENGFDQPIVKTTAYPANAVWG
jgi:phosphoribosylformylglycinamidine (FGAM) synthase PurS component